VTGRVPSGGVGEAVRCCWVRCDLQITGDTLHVRLDTASAPRRSKALAALCAELNQTQTRYPGTAPTLAYSIKDHPSPA